MQVEVGTIFQGLYGNESSRFYEVVKATAKTVTVKEIEAVCTASKAYTAHSEVRSWMPVPGKFCKFWSSDDLTGTQTFKSVKLAKGCFGAVTI